MFAKYQIAATIIKYVACHVCHVGRKTMNDKSPNVTKYGFKAQKVDYRRIETLSVTVGDDDETTVFAGPEGIENGQSVTAETAAVIDLDDVA